MRVGGFFGVLSRMRREVVFEVGTVWTVLIYVFKLVSFGG